jgi:hypothetical protein
MPITNIKVKLVGTDGNAFALMGKVSQALRKGGHSELVDEFRKEATSGDYDHLIQTCCKYVEVR